MEGEERQGWVGVGQAGSGAAAGAGLMLPCKRKMEYATLAKLEAKDNCGFPGRQGRAVHLGKTKSSCCLAVMQLPDAVPQKVCAARGSIVNHQLPGWGAVSAE